MKEKIARLKQLLTEADALAAELGADPLTGKLAQPAAIRSAIANGALGQIEALEKLTAPPAPVAAKK